MNGEHVGWEEFLGFSPPGLSAAGVVTPVECSEGVSKGEGPPVVAVEIDV